MSENNSIILIHFIISLYFILSPEIDVTSNQPLLWKPRCDRKYKQYSSLSITQFVPTDDINLMGIFERQSGQINDE